MGFGERKPPRSRHPGEGPALHGDTYVWGNWGCWLPRLSTLLFKKESEALSDKESLTLWRWEQALSGESRKEVFLKYVERLNLL